MAKLQTKASGASLWLRLILIPYAAVYVWLMGLFDLHSLDFIKRFMDFWGRDAYTLNFVCAAVCAVGLLLLIFAPSRFRLITGVGLIMFLMPVWFQGSETVATGPNEPQVLRFEWNTLRFLFEVASALWSLELVRGEEKTEWVKLIIAPIILVINVLCYLTGGDPLERFQLIITILPLSLLTGFMVDFAYNGFSAQPLIPAAIAIAASLLIGIAEPAVILWGMAILSLAGIILLCVKKSLRTNSLGSILTLICILVNTAVIMLSYLWKIDLPKLF